MYKNENMRPLYALVVVLALLLGLVCGFGAIAAHRQRLARHNAATPLWGQEAQTYAQPYDIVDVHAQRDDAGIPAPSPTQQGDWRLILVNRWQPLPQNYAVEIVGLRNEQSVDVRCYEALQAMMDCRAAGLQPLICSSYRTLQAQEKLFENKKQRLLAAGVAYAAVEEEAARVVARPGTSEHHLGLAVDIVDIHYQQLDSAQEQTAVQQWLLQHCWEYGFILRYPNGKSDITGIIYEPWHYRYVGVEAALAMQQSGQCLEEYLQFSPP